MKQFIYLDTDIVTSIIAQQEKGIITQTSFENETEDTESSSGSIATKGNAKGQAKFWKFVNAEGEFGVSSEYKNANGSRSSTKDVAEKILHDAAFDIAYSYIKPVQVSSGDTSVGEEGEYLELLRVFDYVDFEYLTSLFDKGSVIDFIKKNEAEKIETEAHRATQELNREQFRKAETATKNRIKQSINISNKQYDDIQMIIKAIKGLIPYNRMLVSNDGFLIPLDDKYFRINPSSLGFKYGGMMTCVGMVTNIIGKDSEPIDDKNVFSKLQFSVNEVLRNMLPTKNDNLCVIHPIAIYYGQ